MGEKAAMSKMERIKAALAGQPVDLVPISFWGHNYLKEWTPQGLAEAMLEFQQKYDWDYMKVNPRASYFVEDWGCKFQPSGDPYMSPTSIDYAVKSTQDWARLEVLDPQKGVLAEHLYALQLISEGLRGEVPFVQTVFSPLTIADYLVGRQKESLLTYLREDPQSLHQGLAVIAETYAKYVQLCLERGVSGIFFAISGWASRDLLTEEEYAEFGLRYDLKVLTAIHDGAFFNILHICGNNIYFDLLASYPVQVINWTVALPGNPSLREGLHRTDKAVMGGVDQNTTLKDGAPDEVAAEVCGAIERTQGLRLFLAPGCSISPQVPETNLRAARRARDNFGAGKC
ncbi:MAG: Uroporphyrinogen decarboxylase [Actinobacteria bacterium]|nr:Uroporphyrinogen decarboxylase [Actinomycetota bacterium]